jgi:mannose-6-phosphate isomerase
MTPLYPLRFQPLFRRYLWGGRRLGTVLQKPIGLENDYAESWEVVDHGADQSVVAAGSLAGKKLHEIVTERAPELFGRHFACDCPPAASSRFPLLFKLLDCNRNLSVQVHPNDEQAARLNPPDLGKTESWVILEAQPGSLIYAGLQPGVDRETLARAVAEGTTQDCLYQFEPAAGDCVFIPAGIVHALGAGLLVAEIQQSSDTTYRLFDWKRVGADGQPRALHIRESLEVIDYDRGPVRPERPKLRSPGVEQLVACEKFILDRRTFSGTAELGGDDRFHILSVVDGQISLANDPSAKPLTRGETALLPASCGAVAAAGSSATLLDAYLPAYEKR